MRGRLYSVMGVLSEGEFVAVGRRAGPEGPEKAESVRKSVPAETKDFAILQDVGYGVSRFDARQGAFSSSWKRETSEKTAGPVILWENYFRHKCTIFVRFKEGRFGEDLPSRQAGVVHRLCGK